MISVVFLWDLIGLAGSKSTVFLIEVGKISQYNLCIY